MSNTPHEDGSATEQLLESISFVRVTHYGGFYDFIPDLALADTAYTNLALPAHTDTTYFTDPAGLQSFHLLSHFGNPSSDGGAGELGGKSLLVDGFHAANILREEEPKAFEILTRVKIPWHASGNQGITIAPDKKYPVLELDETTGEIHRVRWNNDDRGIVPFDDGISPSEWYDAARKWYSILTRPDVELWTQLKPGQPISESNCHARPRSLVDSGSTLVFDNWRVLHGRSAFEGVRRICGGYSTCSPLKRPPSPHNRGLQVLRDAHRTELVNRDDFISRWRNTNFPRGEILNRVVG